MLYAPTVTERRLRFMKLIRIMDSLGIITPPQRKINYIQTQEATERIKNINVKKQ